MDELEKAYQILLDYEKEVKEFLLYVCGYHPNIEKYNIFMITSSLYSKQLTTNENILLITIMITQF